MSPLAQYPPPPYGANHMRVKYHRGKAAAQLCAGCCGRAGKDWALIHGRSGADPFDYLPMCRRCHYQYDKETQSQGPAKRSLNPSWQESRSRIPRDELGRWSAE